MAVLSIFAPAKLNLYLAVTGQRPDGFHDLVSVVALLDFGDTLHVEAGAGPQEPPEFSLTCNDPDVPCDGTNLILMAARAFATATGWNGGATFRLEKRIPMGAGLGGGSSDAVATLKALNRLVGPNRALTTGALMDLAATLGSDCPLFLGTSPAVLRGRGERVAPLPSAVARRLHGRRVLVFKPAFGIATPWAYARLRANAPASYLPLNAAEARLAQWQANGAATTEELLFNNMEPAAFTKFIALPVLRARLEANFGLQPHMSGSGSACFAFLNDDTDVTAVTAAIREAWGESAFVVATQLASGA
jgi:4-diphosphocytidyl-2-C-methyl-D-erythritol kinase